MAHRLSIQNGRAEFLYTGDSPWHGLGEHVPDHMTAVDAVARVIPFTVSTRPVRFQGAENSAFDTDAPGVRVIVRDDTRRHLGVATGAYQPIQNTQAADVADALIAEGAKCVETVGALDDGARCFLLLTLDKTGFEVTKGDTVLPYFLLRWGHDGRTTLAGKLTGVRVVCHNTLTAAGSAFAFDVKHTANAKLRIEDARSALSVARKAYVDTRTQYRTLAATRIPAPDAVKYFAGVFPAPVDITIPASTLDKTQAEKLDRWNAVQARILDMYQGAGRGAELAGPTAWGAYNAVTEYLDHVYPVLQSGKVSADRQQSVLFGAYGDIRARAYADALTLAK